MPDTPETTRTTRPARRRRARPASPPHQLVALVALDLDPSSPVAAFLRSTACDDLQVGAERERQEHTMKKHPMMRDAGTGKCPAAPKSCQAVKARGRELVSVRINFAK